MIPVEHWTPEEVSAWINHVGFSEHAQSFLGKSDCEIIKCEVLKMKLLYWNGLFRWNEQFLKWMGASFSSRLCL